MNEEFRERARQYFKEKLALQKKQMNPQLMKRRERMKKMNELELMVVSATPHYITLNGCHMIPAELSFVYFNFEQGFTRQKAFYFGLDETEIRIPEVRAAAAKRAEVHGLPISKKGNKEQGFKIQVRSAQLVPVLIEWMEENFSIKRHKYLYTPAADYDNVLGAFDWMDRQYEQLKGELPFNAKRMKTFRSRLVCLEDLFYALHVASVAIPMSEKGESYIEGWNPDECSPEHINAGNSLCKFHGKTSFDKRECAMGRCRRLLYKMLEPMVANEWSDNLASFIPCGSFPVPQINAPRISGGTEGEDPYFAPVIVCKKELRRRLNEAELEAAELEREEVGEHDDQDLERASENE